MKRTDTMAISLCVEQDKALLEKHGFFLHGEMSILPWGGGLNKQMIVEYD